MTTLPKTPAPRAEGAREAKAGVVMGAFMTALVTIPLEAFVLMVLMAALHGVAGAVPAVGYVSALVLVVGADFVIAKARRLFRK